MSATSGRPSSSPWYRYVDPGSAFVATPAAAVDPGGLKREVFGFLPYWELTDPSTRLDWEKLSTVAYFGIGTGAGLFDQRQGCAADLQQPIGRFFADREVLVAELPVAPLPADCSFHTYVPSSPRAPPAKLGS